MDEAKNFFKRKQEFPNHFAEGIDVGNVIGCEKRINLLSLCLEDILCRLRIPYKCNGEVYYEGFFEHLSSIVKKNYGESVQLYIGGGVVRSLIAYLYRYVHIKKIYAHSLASTEEILINFLKKAEKYFNQVEVLGVGSDLDIYYILHPTNDLVVSDFCNLDNLKAISGFEVHDEKKKAKTAEFLENLLKESINAVEEAFHLNSYNDPIKKSFIPVCDIKPYYEHLQNVMQQGGAHCDWLAFEFCGSAVGKDRFKSPEEDPDLVYYLLIRGEYAYTTPKEGATATQKQTIRGCRGLLELPFLKISDPTVLSKELNDVKNSFMLEYDAKEQIEKLVRNAYFGAANNRVYRSKPGQPLAILGALSVEHHQEANDPYLIPYFLPGFSHQLKKNDLDLETYLISREQFILDHTDQGILYHGTTQVGLLSIIRSGFWISDDNLGQGQSVYGPGVYCTPTKTISESYTKGSKAHYIQISLNSHYTPRILNWDKVPQTTRESWENFSLTNGHAHVFLMLREQYAIDIIIHEHIILQNFYAIKVYRCPEKLIQSRIDNLFRDFDQKNSLEKFNLFMDMAPLFYLAQAAAIKLNETLSALIERHPALFLIKSGYNPLENTTTQSCVYFSAIAQTMDVLLEGIEQHEAEKLFLSGAKYGLTRLMATLWNAGISLNVCDENGDTALHYAVNNECYNSIAWLVAHKAILELPNDDGVMPLYFTSDKPLVLSILKENGAYDFPFHLAAQQGDVHILEKLESLPINARDIFGFTPLHYAISEGHIEMTEALLARHADIYLSTPDGNTAISMPTSASMLQCITRYRLTSLLSHEFSLPVYLKRENFNNDFEYACFEYLLGEVFLEKSPEKQLKILLILTSHFLKSGFSDSASELIKDHQRLFKVHADYPNFDIFEKINSTFKEHAPDIKTALDFFKPFITLDVTGMDMTSPPVIKIFLSAVEYNVEEVVLCFLKSGIDPNSGQYRNTALSLSINHRHAALLKPLADHGAIFKLSLRSPYLLDELISEEGDRDIIIALRQIREENDEKFLGHSAAKTGNLAWILEQPVDSLGLSIYDRYGLTPLHYAAMEGYVHLMEILLKKGADINQVDYKGRTAFHLAAKYGKTSVISHFAYLKNPDIWNLPDNKLNTVAHLAVRYGHASIVSALTGFSFVIFCLPNQKGKTPGELVWNRKNNAEVKLNKIRSFAEIIREASKLMQLNKKYAFSSLPDNYQCILKTLKDYRRFLYNFPLHVAARESDIEIFRENFSELHIHQKDFYGFTPLHYAALKGNVEIIDYLLGKGANINVMCYAGCIPLHLAILIGNKEVVEFLIKRNAALTLPFYLRNSIVKNLKKWGILESSDNLSGAYPIHIAVEKGHVDIVKLLILNKIDINSVNNSGDTPLKLAYENKRNDIIQILIKDGAQLGKKEREKGETLSYLAVQDQNWPLIEILIQENVYSNEPDKDGITPSHLAAINGNTAMVALLIQHGLFINNQDNHGFAPIHWAVACGDIDSVKQIMFSFDAPMDREVRTFCPPESLREKYCEIILYFSKKIAYGSKTLSLLSISRIEKLIAAKMAKQEEKINSAISLEELAYLTGNMEMINYLSSQPPRKGNWMSPEKILNHNNYVPYRGRFFNAQEEPDTFFKKLINKREEVRCYLDDVDSFGGWSEDEFYDEDYFFGAKSDDSSCSI